MSEKNIDKMEERKTYKNEENLQIKIICQDISRNTCNTDDIKYSSNMYICYYKYGKIGVVDD